MSHDPHIFHEEGRLIPKWAIALAVLLFLGGQALFQYLMGREPHPPPELLQIFLGGLVGTILAVWTLLVGYVTRDARRRGMRVWAWTLLVIFVPEGIGFIIYFLLRQPLLVVCPQCAAVVSPPANFCRACGYPLQRTCSSCGHAVGPGDAYCVNCGRPLRPSLERQPQES